MDADTQRAIQSALASQVERDEYEERLRGALIGVSNAQRLLRAGNPHAALDVLEAVLASYAEPASPQ